MKQPLFCFPGLGGTMPHKGKERKRIHTIASTNHHSFCGRHVGPRAANKRVDEGAMRLWNYIVGRVLHVDA